MADYVAVFPSSHTYRSMIYQRTRSLNIITTHKSFDSQIPGARRRDEQFRTRENRDSRQTTIHSP